MSKPAAVGLTGLAAIAEDDAWLMGEVLLQGLYELESDSASWTAR